MDKKLKNLHIFNFVIALFHAIQGIFVLILSDPDRGIVPITINYLTFDVEAQTLSYRADCGGKYCMVCSNIFLYECFCAFVYINGIQEEI